jgi:hypothetical protein
MKKLITGAIVAAALAVPATPALAIHDPFVPAGVCSDPDASAVGQPKAHGGVNPGDPNRGVSNSFALPMAAQAKARRRELSRQQVDRCEVRAGRKLAHI